METPGICLEMMPYIMFEVWWYQSCKCPLISSSESRPLRNVCLLLQTSSHPHTMKIYSFSFRSMHKSSLGSFSSKCLKKRKEGKNWLISSLVTGGVGIATVKADCFVFLGITSDAEIDVGCLRLFGWDPTFQESWLKQKIPQRTYIFMKLFF